MSSYMFVLIIALSVPLVVSFWPPLKFYRYPKALALSIFFVFFLFGAWDVFATWRGHWTFNPQGVWRMRIFLLPLEEVLFFIVIPFCCIFTWETIKFISRLKIQGGK